MGEKELTQNNFLNLFRFYIIRFLPTAIFVLILLDTFENSFKLNLEIVYNGLVKGIIFSFTLTVLMAFLFQSKEIFYTFENKYIFIGKANHYLEKIGFIPVSNSKTSRVYKSTGFWGYPRRFIKMKFKTGMALINGPFMHMKELQYYFNKNENLEIK